MTAATLTLTDFLLARIAEDEETSGDIHYWECDFFSVDIADVRGECDCNGPERARAECAAKRRIVRLATEGFEHNPNPTLYYLASVYADHPDYRAEWKV